MNLAIVTSQHSKTGFNVRYTKVDNNTKQPLGQLSLTTPMQVIFEGIQTQVYRVLKQKQLQEQLTKMLNTIPQNYLFLQTGAWLKGNIGHDRKDIGMLIRSFLTTFKGYPQNIRPALLLKTSIISHSKTDKAQILQRLNGLRDQQNMPHVYLLHGQLTQHQMATLYNHPKVKTMVTFTHGQGYCLPLAQFATTGKPIIAPKYSGYLDFLNESNSTLLQGKLNKIDQSSV